MHRRTFRRVAKAVVVWIVILTFFMDTAAACHLFWRRSCRFSRPAYCGPPVYVNSYVPCYPVVIAPDCVVTHVPPAPPSSGAYRDRRRRDSYAPSTPRRPREGGQAPSLREQPQRRGTIPPVREETEPLPFDEEDDRAAPQLPSEIEMPPRGTEASPNDLNNLLDEEPSAPQGRELPPAETPAEEPSDIFDNLFDESPAKPATEPSEPAPTPQGDTPPSALDDLFEGGAQEGASDADSSGGPQSSPAGTAKAPPQIPAARQDASRDLDDPLGDSPGTDSPDSPAGGTMRPSETAADEEPGIFGGAPDQPNPSRSADPTGNDADELFGEPADSSTELPAPPQNTTPDEGLNLDDLFNDSSSVPSQSPPVGQHGANPDSIPNQPLADQSIDGYRQSSGQLVSASALASPSEHAVAAESPRAQTDQAALGPNDASEAVNPSTWPAAVEAVDLTTLPIRRWTDNTGIYHTQGRLVLIREGYVRLLKTNGRFTTVPLRRLSQTDLEYVMSEGATLGITPVIKVAGR